MSLADVYNGKTGGGDENNGVSTDVQSFTFDRYLKARERVSAQAMEHVDKLNKSAISRVKHSKLNEKQLKDADA